MGSVFARLDIADSLLNFPLGLFVQLLEILEEPLENVLVGLTGVQTGIAGRWSNALDGDTSPRRAYQNGRLEGRWMRHGPLRGGSSEVPPIAHEFQLRSHRLGQGMRAGSGIPPKGIPFRNSVDFPRRQTHAFASHRPG